MKNPILRNGVRILRPVEYKLMVQNLKSDYQIMFKALLFTGMRYIEAQRFQCNPKWFDNDFINLPSAAILKLKVKQRERAIRLNPIGKTIVPLFLDLDKKLPSRISWQEDLKRWAINENLTPDGLCAKTTRKTWESWLMFYYPTRQLEILLSQGHNSVTSLRHYLNMPFTVEDKMLMEEYVSGW